MNTYDLPDTDGLRLCCGENPLFHVLEFTGGNQYVIECRKNGHLHNTGLHMTRSAAVTFWNSKEETPRGTIFKRIALVTEDDYGMTHCGACNDEIICDVCGDMPDFCPHCGAKLDWSLYEKEV